MIRGAFCSLIRTAGTPLQASSGKEELTFSNSSVAHGQVKKKLSHGVRQDVDRGKAIIQKSNQEARHCIRLHSSCRHLVVHCWISGSKSGAQTNMSRKSSHLSRPKLGTEGNNMELDS